MFEGTVYRQSKSRFIMNLIIDGLLCLVIIGLFLLIYHIIEYYRNELMLTKTGILLKRGLFVINTTEIPYTKVNSVSTKRNLLGTYFGYGDIFILSGNDLRGECFKGIRDPEALKHEIINRTYNLDRDNPNNRNNYNDLEELAKLKDNGIITQEEFDQKKKQILGLTDAIYTN